MVMEIVLSDGDRVEAISRSGRIVTDQDGSAPAPFDLFLASIGTCVGFYVAKFCRQRGIRSDGIRIHESTVANRETEMVERIELDIRLPPDFPERYRDAVIRAAKLCAVKKHVSTPLIITGRGIAKGGGR